MQSNNYTESNEVNTDNENTNSAIPERPFSMPKTTSASFVDPPTNTLPAVFRFAPTATFGVKPTDTVPATVPATDAVPATDTATGMSFGGKPTAVPAAGMSFGGKPNVTMASASMAGGFGFGLAQHTQRTSTGGCCNPFPFGNPPRHPETGQTMPPQTSVFGIRTDKPSNAPRDKLIDELYSELRNLREHVDTSNKIIGNMYELLRKL